MKDLVQKLQSKKLIFKSLKPIEPKALGSRKRVQIYLGVDLKSYYTLIMVLEKKSRFLQKEAQELLALHEKLETLQESKIKKNHLFIKAPLCSKAKALLEKEKWKVWHES
jgi:hypothetical protein